MNKKNFFDLLYIILILFLIIFMIWIIYYLKGTGKDCLAHPIEYFEANNDGVSCFCMKNGVIYDREEYINVDSETEEIIKKLT